MPCKAKPVTQAGGVISSGSLSERIQDSFGFHLGYTETSEALFWDLFTTKEDLWISTLGKYQLTEADRTPFYMGVKARLDEDNAGAAS